jgi:hypothetical protein
MQSLFKFSAIVFSLTLISSAQTAVPDAPPASPVIPGIPAPSTAKVKPPLKAIKILGWKEWAWVVKPELVLRAKLDTGARTSSVHATNIEQVEIDGKKWVKFTISNPNDEESLRLRHRAPLVRVSKIKNDSGGLDERYVVILTFQLGNQQSTGEFNLNNRENMTCAMLIGRNLLQQLGMVDAGRTDLLKRPGKSKLKATKKKKPANK